MPRPPINSDETVIETGETLTVQLGREATATDIHKFFDGQGNYRRIRRVWEEHLANKGDEQPSDNPLPENACEQIRKVLASLETGIENVDCQ